MRKLSYTVPHYLLRSVYFSLIHSHLQYLAVLWFTAGVKVNALKTLQNKAIKNIYSVPPRYSTENLYKNFNIMSVEKIYKYQVCLYIHQVIHKTRHSNITFEFRNEFHNYNTRIKNHINVTQVSSKFASLSIYVTGVTLYNQLPNHVKNYSTKKFKLYIRRMYS